MYQDSPETLALQALLGLSVGQSTSGLSHNVSVQQMGASGSPSQSQQQCQQQYASAQQDGGASPSLSGQHQVPPSLSGQHQVPMQPTISPDTKKFLASIIAQGGTQATTVTLVSNGITSYQILSYLQDQDLSGLGLDIGQLRLLQGVRDSLRNTNPQGPQNPPENQEFSLETRRRLGISQPGKSHLSVPNFVTIIRNGKEVDEDEAIELPDGSKFLPKGKERGTIKLDNIGALQWVEGAMKIMGRMIIEGLLKSPEEIAQHTAYIAEIARLGQKKTWRSVVYYDDAYRQAQAIQGFAWGVRDIIELRDVHLEHRPSGEHQAKQKGPSKKPRMEQPSHQRGQNNLYKLPHNKVGQFPEMRLCEFFNSKEKTCTRSTCTKLHLCAKCGAKAHGAGACPE